VHYEANITKGAQKSKVLETEFKIDDLCLYTDQLVSSCMMNDFLLLDRQVFRHVTVAKLHSLMKNVGC
jgi:hypothetical protein